MKQKIIYFIFLIIFLLFYFSTFCFAWGEPELVNKLNSAFESIRDWLIKLATPAAAGAGAYGKRGSAGGDGAVIPDGRRDVRGRGAQAGDAGRLL